MALSKIKSSSMADTAIHGRRNLIINGAMTIDQRNSGSSVNLANAKVFVVDRFYWIENSSETPTSQQVTDAPNGFTHSVKITNTSTTTTPSYTQLIHRIEGNNVSQLYFGNSSAESVTLSFYVKSSLTGQFSASLRNADSDRSNVSTYTINSANTWERKIITFVGRLNHSKGYDFFSKAILKILDEFPKWSALSIGDEDRRSIYINHIRHKELGFLNHKKTLIFLNRSVAIFLFLPSQCFMT